ncbi:FMN-dependent NADH-azoreductase [Heyndrickxia sporothermodurans]|uniref:FMN dependent NADH:quinone oxidoreductase n=1 Tax=Heyndrickxia sporothermodurans TaxID=46224 RepID=A0AB37HPK1_9BACI|nr:FMN-dependent NADH-azoreductase [Heyndrickxia sporothermodurans]MBL5769094.1 FMN-dependent NADH-azoreductase [Heyndrickxia sporothermodurans]MBL5772886.1 FMN-dependent NADH-azoreductase [Heyndrickxia sporothermodurans]MBL5776396.1 FMN-dependent NADH-azoreductase [Heyndrickxia sporothermodurans]MBL5780039.1 FMN-dependent NADH-azoreductase [Heyndrickxia sporothermodurans]MBL5783649.1 FMN-dependent NADH-azoreductase [Heyndrickxia sporothermodurans]
MNLLVVKANNRPEGVSSKMYETFMESINDAKNLNVTVYDVFEEDMPYFGQELFNAFGKLQSGEELSELEQRLLAAKQKAKDVFATADVVVFVFPLWNLTVPAKLHTFIDYIDEAGYTFKYGPDGSPVYLMPEKKIILMNARGGYYSSPEMQNMEHAVNYMRSIFAGMFGMEVTEEVVIEGHNASPDKAEEIIENGMRKVTETAEKLAYQYV